VMGSSNCPTIGYNGTLTMGTLGSGTIIGSATQLQPGGGDPLSGGTINATMNGTQLTGTFAWHVAYSTGQGVYTFSFQGTQILPP